MPIISKALISSFIEKYLACFDDKNAGIVFALSFLFTTIWFFTAPVIFTADSESYLSAARAMLGLPGGYFLYFRTEGYPLILNLSGVTLFDTFIGLWIIQYSCAVFIPLIIYQSLKGIDKQIAFSAAILCIISTVPFIYSKAVMTQQVYLFLQTLVIYLSIRSCNGLYTAPVYWLTLIFTFLVTIRPSAIGLFFIIIGIIIIARHYFHKNNNVSFFHPAIALVLFLSSQQIISVYHSAIADPILPLSSSEKIKSGRSNFNATGKLLFFNPYVAGKIYNPGGLVKKGNGPATERLLSILQNFIKTSPQVAADFLDDLADNPSDDQIIKRFIIESDGKSHYAWWAFSDSAIGIDNSDKLFFKATIETLINHPVFLLHYLRNFCLIFIGIDQNVHYGHLKFNMPGPFTEQKMESSVLSRQLWNEIESSKVSRNHILFYRLWSYYFMALKVLVSIVAFIFLFQLIKKKQFHPVWLLVFSIWGYEYLVISIFAEPKMHYVSLGILPLIITSTPLLLALKHYLFENMFIRN